MNKNNATLTEILLGCNLLVLCLNAMLRDEAALIVMLLVAAVAGLYANSLDTQTKRYCVWKYTGLTLPLLLGLLLMG